jgi:hypothetical protein
MKALQRFTRSGRSKPTAEDWGNQREASSGQEGLAARIASTALAETWETTAGVRRPG